MIRTLVDEDQSGGPREAIWNGKDDHGVAVSSGIYLYVLDAGAERLTRRLVLLKYDRGWEPRDSPQLITAQVVTRDARIVWSAIRPAVLPFPKPAGSAGT